MGGVSDPIEWLMGRFGRTVRERLRGALAQLEQTLVEAVADDGAVRVKMNGRGNVISIEIAPHMLCEPQRDRLQQLLAHCVQKAIDDAGRLRQTRIVEALPEPFQPMAKEILLENA